MGKEDKLKKPTEKDGFNGVEARHNLAAKAFEDLKKIVEADVNERNKQTPEILNFESPSDKEFWAWRRAPKIGVIFLIKNAAILVRNLEDKLVFRLDLTLNEDGELRFKVEGEEGEFLPWQVAQKALEDISF